MNGALGLQRKWAAAPGQQPECDRRGAGCGHDREDQCGWEGNEDQRDRTRKGLEEVRTSGDQREGQELKGKKEVLPIRAGCREVYKVGEK